MTELIREKFVNRLDKTRKNFRGIANDPIRVSFYDIDGKRVNDVTRKEANEIATSNPSQLFYFQDKNRIQQELNITQVNNLKSNTDLKSTSPCSVGPVPCGPPFLNIFGGEGFGVLANPIISPITNAPIAFDIINGGRNYTTPPFAQLVDLCGNGSGNRLQTEISQGRVIRIIIKSPGDGYLPAPDGSYGGGGRVIKRPNEGLVKRNDGTFEVTPSNVVPELQIGDVFISPIPKVPPTTGVLPVKPVVLGPTYPVVLEIEDLDIINPGFGYQPGDKIIIDQDRGAVLEPVIDNGRIVKVNIIKPGIGFDTFPEITTNSPTGYNFSARPIFKARRLDEEKSFVPPQDATIISVVDCVGRIPPQVEFDRVPR